MHIPKFPVIILALISVVPAVAWALGIRLNLTASLPLGLYIATSQPSDYVAFCIGDPWERIALERLYITPGHCPAGGIPLFKRIVARPGDLVTLDAWGIAVNGRVLPRTAPMLADSSGRPMRHYPFGSYSVAPGTFWVASSYDERSFDSRYYGPIAAGSIRLYNLHPLLIQGAPCS